MKIFKDERRSAEDLSLSVQSAAAAHEQAADRLCKSAAAIEDEAHQVAVSVRSGVVVLALIGLGALAVYAISKMEF